MPKPSGHVIAYLLFSFVLVPLLGTGAIATTSLVLDPQLEAGLPQFDLVSANEEGVHLFFELPAVEVETFELDGVIYHTVAVPGGQLHGEPGEPSLPAFTRLVAIPSRAGVGLEVGSVEWETFPGFHLLPMQELEGEEFRIDRTLYRTDDFLGGELVTIGDPSLFRDLRVVPLSFRPVRFNPATGEVQIARRIEVTVRFAGVDLRSTRERARIPTTPGFRRLFEHAVINYGYEEDHPRGDAPHLGTWLCIAPNNGTVLNLLEPLVEWRARMGYNAVLVNTSETGTSPSSIRSWLRDAYAEWEYPPEYITIVGDANGTIAIGTFNESYSGCYGEGDHPYTQLDGDDLWPDAAIGRLSVESTSRLELVVNKILGYESTPATSDPSWFTRACLVGDPGHSGYSCVQIQQWLKERLRDLGYDDIDTVWASPFVDQIRNSLNQGATYFGYRGYWGTSGWDDYDVNVLTNGWKMVFAINLTCGTGSFASGTSLNETWLRAGSPPNSPTGGIGSIGTATLCTATRYNNCFYGGSAYGLFWEGHYQLGPAHARGKVEMILNYAEVQYNSAAAYIWWNNLMGDPATELWTGFPEPLTVTHAATVPLGATQVPVTVRDDGGQPVEGAWVYLLKEGQIAIGDCTNASGQVELPVDAQTPGTVLVTVTGHNLHPYQGSFTIAQQDHFVGLGGYLVDDDISGESYGNGDGATNPGERIELEISLHNYGRQDEADVSLHVSTEDPYVGLITQNPIDYGTIDAGQTAEPPQPILLRVYEGCPVADYSARLDLRVSSGLQNWQSIIDLPITGADLNLREVQLADVGDGVLDPGEEGQMVTVLRNDGTLTAQGPIQLYLISDSYNVHVIDPTGSIAESIQPGWWNGNWPDRFGVSSPADCIPGLLGHLRVIATFADGVIDTIPVSFTVGSGDYTDPTGPDDYGYIAYDQTDTGYEEAPVYSWIEINPDDGGPGTDVGLTDYDWDEDDSRTVDLPFTFTYYGQAFDRATICSNGWMAMGDTYLTNRRNWYMPSAGGPANMLAPFWDNLYQSGNGRVYEWFDQANHRYVVAWDEVRNEAGNQQESFEIVLYDPAYYPTLTGDGVFVFQYADINNSDNLQMYATSGIQDEFHTTGITFNYFNRRPATAAPFVDGLAVKFTTGGPGAADAHSDVRPQPVFLLRQNEPNPFRAGTTIRFGLDRAGPVTLRVFDVDGRLVRTLLRGTLTMGAHAVDWRGFDDRGFPVPTGIYFYSLDAADRSISRKLLLLP